MMAHRSSHLGAGPPGAPVTMEDLAQLAGVSVSTVSRALRGHSGVKSATARRVQELARTHHFQPNHAAARLRQGATRTIAVAVPAINTWYFSEVVAGAQTVLARAGYDTLVAVVSGPGSLERILHDAAPQSGRVDGVILADLLPPDSLLSDMQSTRTRMVVIGRASSWASSVHIDDVEVGRTATAHLLGLGHEVVGLVKGQPSSPFRYDAAEQRRRGYLLALAEAGIEARPELEVSGSYTVVGGAQAVRALLKVDPAPTAVFCTSDQMAIGAIRSIHEAGLRIPHDVSLVGVDNHDVARAVGLTTVAQDAAAIGARAAQMMLGHLAGEVDLVHDLIPTRLIVRHTTRLRVRRP